MTGAGCFQPRQSPSAFQGDQPEENEQRNEKANVEQWVVGKGKVVLESGSGESWEFRFFPVIPKIRIGVGMASVGEAISKIGPSAFLPLVCFAAGGVIPFFEVVTQICLRRSINPIIKSVSMRVERGSSLFPELLHPKTSEVGKRPASFRRVQLCKGVEEIDALPGGSQFDHTEKTFLGFLIGFH